MKYLRTIKGCTRLDQIRNEDIRNEMGISPLSEKIIEYRNKWKAQFAKNGTYPHSTTGIHISTIRKTKHT
jgi:hypothetical protein